MFLTNNKSNKNFSTCTLKTSEPVRKLKISKHKITPIPQRTGLKTAKNIPVKKTKNLYYELKDAMLEKFVTKGTGFGSKRNSFQNLHSISNKGNTLEFSNFNSLPLKQSVVSMANLPQTTRMADVSGKAQFKF